MTNLTPEQRVRIEDYIAWLSDPRDDGNPYDLPSDVDQPKEADLRSLLAAYDAQAAMLKHPDRVQQLPPGTELLEQMAEQQMVQLTERNKQIAQLTADLTAARQAAVGEGVRDAWLAGEAVWLIETPQTANGHARWWNPDTGWMIDPNKGLRLSRREDADAVIRSSRGLLHCQPTEHVWYERKLWPKPLGHAYRDIDVALSPSPVASGAEADVAALVEEANTAAKFYAERPAVDEQKRGPSLEEITRREALENAMLLRRLATALSQQARASVEGDWVLVPREPDHDMIRMGEDAALEHHRLYEAGEAEPYFADEVWWPSPARVYRAMIAAAPRASVEEARRPGMEEIARMIDPGAFSHDEGSEWLAGERKDATRKARAILALFPTQAGRGR